MSDVTHYTTLRVATNATPEQVEQSWRQLRRTLHPDLGGNVELFAALSEAYHVLSDPERRASYDLQLPEVAQENRARVIGETDRRVQDYLDQRQQRVEQLRSQASTPVRVPQRTLVQRLTGR